MVNYEEENIVKNKMYLILQL